MEQQVFRLTLLIAVRCRRVEVGVWYSIGLTLEGRALNHLNGSIA